MLTKDTWVNFNSSNHANEGYKSDLVTMYSFVSKKVCYNIPSNPMVFLSSTLSLPLVFPMVSRSSILSLPLVFPLISLSSARYCAIVT